MLKSAVCIALEKEALVPQDLASVDMLHYLGTNTLAVRGTRLLVLPLIYCGP